MLSSSSSSSSSNEMFKTVNKRKKKKTLPAPAREIISNVINFLKEEAENGYAIPLINFRQRTTNATGVSDRTYRSIKDEIAKIERGEIKGFVTPRGTRRTPTKLMDIEKIKIIRELIYNFHVSEKRPPTIDNLMAKIKAENISIGSGTITALWRFMQKIGYQNWFYTKSKSKIIMESNDNRCKRIQYLKKLLEYRQQGRPIVYVDEQYIDSLFMQKYCRNNAEPHLKKTINKSRRLVVAGAKEGIGFTPNCLLMLIRNLEAGDYYDDNNNSQQFLKWVEKKLIPNLPPKSVLVINNSIYQNIKSKTTHNMFTKKDMIEWLQKKNVSFNADMTKVELNTLIMSYKLENSAYILDELLEKYGHSILRLPLYHSELSPITEIWEIIQDWVVSDNVTLKMVNEQYLVKQKFDSLTKHDWNQFCDHVEDIEKEYMKRELVIDTITDDLQILLETHKCHKKDNQVVNDEIMEIEDLSDYDDDGDDDDDDDETEEICCISNNWRRSINLVPIPIKTKIDNDVPIEIKQEKLNDDDELIEISEWKPSPPVHTDSIVIKEELKIPKCEKIQIDQC